MAEEEVTLGRKSTGGGFGKKPLPVTMQVNADEVQAMQRGYEERIARQYAAITRLQALLADRTEQIAQWMTAEADRAANTEQDNHTALLAVAGGVIPDEELDELMKLIPADWDFYGEDDTPRTALAAYIRHLQEEVEHQKGKQSSLVKHYQQPGDRLMRWLSDRVIASIMTGKELDEAVITYVSGLEERLAEAERNLSQAITDARHNAKIANHAQAALPVVNGDDTPPWEQPQGQAFVAPADHNQAAQWTLEPDPSQSTTLTDWAGGHLLPPGEQRPGSF